MKKNYSPPWSRERRRKYVFQAFWENFSRFVFIGFFASFFGFAANNQWITYALLGGSMVFLIFRSVDNSYFIRKEFAIKIEELLAKKQREFATRMTAEGLWFALSRKVDVRRRDLFDEALADLVYSGVVVEYEPFNHALEYEINIDDGMDYALMRTH